MNARKLTGVTVLIVEDDALILTDLSNILETAGASTIPVRTLRAGLEACGKRIDAAVLDVRLGDVTAIPIADQLEGAGIPVIFHAVDFAPIQNRPTLSNAVRLSKPANETILIDSVMQSVNKG